MPLQRPNQRYAHVHDGDFREHALKAIRQLQAALSETAIDHYAAEKLRNAEVALGDAIRCFKQLHPEQEL
jgi:hypothetical protein